MQVAKTHISLFHLCLCWHDNIIKSYNMWYCIEKETVIYGLWLFQVNKVASLIVNGLAGVRVYCGTCHVVDNHCGSLVGTTSDIIFAHYLIVSFISSTSSTSSGGSITSWPSTKFSSWYQMHKLEMGIFMETHSRFKSICPHHINIHLHVCCLHPQHNPVMMSKFHNPVS